MVLKVELRIKEQSLTCFKLKTLFPTCLHFMEFLNTVISSLTFSDISLTLALCPLPVPTTPHLCLSHVYSLFLFYFFLSISLHSVLSPYLHSSRPPFSLNLFFLFKAYSTFFCLKERKKKEINK